MHRETAQPLNHWQTKCQADAVSNWFQFVSVCRTGSPSLSAKLRCKVESKVDKAVGGWGGSHSGKLDPPCYLVAADYPVLGSALLKFARTESSPWGVSEDSSRPA